jgi:hypothetical protein
MIRSAIESRFAGFSLRRVVGGIVLLSLAAGLAWLPLTWGVLLAAIAAGGLAGSCAGRGWSGYRWRCWLPSPAACANRCRHGDRAAAGGRVWRCGLSTARGGERSGCVGRLIIALAALYAGAQFVSLFFAVNLGEGAAEVIKWVELPVILLVVPAMMTSRQGRWLAAALLLGACAQAALGLYQFVYRIGPDVLRCNGALHAGEWRLCAAQPVWRLSRPRACRWR